MHYMERLQKVIANCGYCSRRKAEKLIVENRVIVNGKLVNQLGVQVSDKDKIEIDGVRLERQDKVYFLLNKPRGVVTTAHDDKKRKTVVDLIETGKRIYPIGRLDYDTTGVLLLTNDGEFAHLLMRPNDAIDKVYIAKVEGIFSVDAFRELKKGVKVGNEVYHASRVKVRKVDSKNKKTLVEITLHEGKNHQVKKMLQAVGFPVIKLKRERFAFLTTGSLLSGEYRELSPKEVHQLFALASKGKEKKIRNK